MPIVKTIRAISLLLLISVISGRANLTYASPCDADVDKVCKDVQPGYGNITSCLNRNKSEVSFACREFIKTNLTVLRKVRSACDSAARQYCLDEKPGYGRVKTCLMNNLDKLPETCQSALKEVTF